MSLQGRNARSHRGGTLVETTLTLVVLFLLIFGIVGFGRAVWAYAWVSHISREATRWACVRGSKSGRATNADAVETFVKSHLMGLNPTQVTVTTTWPLGDDDPGHTVRVRVQYVVTKIVPYVPEMNLESTSEMYIAQ